MQILRSRPRRAADAIVLLKTDEIAPNPYQPRQIFEENALRELSESIRRYGVLSPLSVRKRQGKYELVAGERRLRAAALAGLDEVPCVVLDIDGAESGSIALVENLQREDLDFIEQAQGIARLISLFGMSQQECARRLGISQSALANKLRLLKLPPDVLDALRGAGLTERHGRALLRLPDDDARRSALAHIAARGLTAAGADAYIDGLLSRDEEKAAGSRSRLVLKDVRIFMNTLRRSADVMRRGGVDVAIDQEQTDTEMRITVRIRR